MEANMRENKEMIRETSNKNASSKLVNKLKKANKRLKIFVYLLICICICLSSLLVRSVFFKTSTISTAEGKIEEALNIMGNNWYFGKDIDNLDDRLLNQALTGITTNALNLSLKGKRKLMADEYIKICNALKLPYDFFVNNKSA